MAKVGRPTVYEPAFIEKVDEYLLKCVDEDFEFHKTRGDSSNSFERRIKIRLPSLERFAQFIEVGTRSIFEWEDIYPEFSHALDKIREAQKIRLTEMSLAGEYNSTIAKLMLSSNHGMHDSADIKSDGKVLPTPIYSGKSSDN